MVFPFIAHLAGALLLKVVEKLFTFYYLNVHNMLHVHFFCHILHFIHYEQKLFYMEWTNGINVITAMSKCNFVSGDLFYGLLQFYVMYNVECFVLKIHLWCKNFQNDQN